jgi:hypothetical protein
MAGPIQSGQFAHDQVIPEPSVLSPSLKVLGVLHLIRSKYHQNL